MDPKQNHLDQKMADGSGEIAYQHARNLNGVEIDQSVRESEADKFGWRQVALTREYYEGLDEDINMEEDPWIEGNAISRAAWTK